MYQVLGISRALTVFGVLCAVLGVCWWLAAPPSNEAWQWWGLWRTMSGAVTQASLLVYIFGQTPIFPLLCRLRFLRDWFPPISGEWTATLKSNWPAIQQKPDLTQIAPALQLSDVEANVKIAARLFYIRINLESKNEYSTSRTIFVRASRDAEDGTTMLHYIFRNDTRVPEQTDSSGHDGAACLRVKRPAKWPVKRPTDTLSLEGIYWTNRNWHRGLNTAGTITLRRI
jgi:hypothetical protein